MYEYIDVYIYVCVYAYVYIYIFIIYRYDTPWERSGVPLFYFIPLFSIPFHVVFRPPIPNSLQLSTQATQQAGHMIKAGLGDLHAGDPTTRILTETLNDMYLKSPC